MKTSVSRRTKILSVCAVLLLIFVAVLYFHHLPNFLDRYIELPPFLLKHYPRTNLTKHKPVECEMDKGVEFDKHFIYMIMTESCIPAELLSDSIFGNTENCNCDVLVLGFKSMCSETGNHPAHVTHIHTPGTIWTTGRMLLYNTAKGKDTHKKYMYYIFMDDDVRLKLLTGETRNPYREFEKFLIKYRPPIGAADTAEWQFINRLLRFRDHYNCPKPLDEYVPTVFYDPMYNAFHHDAAVNLLEPLFPYWTKFDSVGMWYSEAFICILGDLMYRDQMVQMTELVGLNPLHRPYTRSFETADNIDDIIATVLKLVPDKYKSYMQLKGSEYRLWQRGLLSYCRSPPTPVGCAQPYQSLSSQSRELHL